MSDVRKATFTDRFLKSLKPSKGGTRTTVWDAVLPGLCVRIGAKPAFYVGKRPTGSKKFIWIKIGDYPVMALAEARSRAREVVSALIEGRPAPAPTKGTMTFTDMAERYIDEILPQKRTAKGCEQAIRRELLPALGDRPLVSIRQDDLVELLKAIAERPERRNSIQLKSGGPHAVRKLHSELRVMMRWAVFNRIGGLQSDPSAAIPISELLRGRSYTKQRARVLTDAELRVIWQAAEETPYPFGPLVKALILTGQRLNEVAQARRGEVDKDQTTLLVPAERMKNKQAHAIPLTGRVRELLDQLPHFEHGDYLFSTTFGRRPVSGFSKMKARLDRAIVAIEPVEPWQLHDLRRTVRTGLSRAEVLPFHAELVIAHTQSGVHGVYDRFRYQREKLDALQRWEQLLDRLLKPPPENVVDMPMRVHA
jgi:integrase